MAELSIPEEQQPALNRIRTMPEESLRAFASAMERSPNTVPSVQGLSPDEAEMIQEAVMELYRVREFFSMEPPAFVEDMAESLQELEGFPAAELPAFKERLTRLLTMDSVSIAAKAASLKLEYERRFCTARILTDARPIYGADPSQPPDAAMIMHVLRISYHDDTSDLREVFIAMDGDDVTTLRDLLDRAEKKAQSLQSVFAAANVKVVAP